MMLFMFEKTILRYCSNIYHLHVFITSCVPLEVLSKLIVHRENLAACVNERNIKIKQKPLSKLVSHYNIKNKFCTEQGLITSCKVRKRHFDIRSLLAVLILPQSISVYHTRVTGCWICISSLQDASHNGITPFSIQNATNTIDLEAFYKHQHIHYDKFIREPEFRVDEQ